MNFWLDINSTKTWIPISAEIRVITRKSLGVGCFESVVMAVIVYSKAVYVHG